MLKDMTFTDVVKDILVSSSHPLTPQDICEIVKNNYPQHYRTPSHLRNVEKGYYKDPHHALLAQIYSLVRVNKSFFCDTSLKPMKISLISPDEHNSAVVMPASKPRINEFSKKYIKRNGARATNNENELLANISHYYEQSLVVSKEFGGPSIYFHVQAIKEQECAFLSDRHIEMIYATLASWGMHRMGDPEDTKTKMVDYCDFHQSLKNNQLIFEKFFNLRMESCSAEQYERYIDELKDIYCSLKVSISEATIVAHSKTLAHILPNLIPPIDRQYTIRFFTQDDKKYFTEKGKYKLINLPSGICVQFEHFKRYACWMKSLLDRCDRDLFIIDKNSFNTSYPKIMDNMIMAFVKAAK